MKKCQLFLPPGVVEYKVPPGVLEYCEGSSEGSFKKTFLVGMALESVACLANGDADMITDEFRRKRINNNNNNNNNIKKLIEHANETETGSYD